MYCDSQRPRTFPVGACFRLASSRYDPSAVSRRWSWPSVLCRIELACSCLEILLSRHFHFSRIRAVLFPSLEVLFSVCRKSSLGCSEVVLGGLEFCYNEWSQLFNQAISTRTDLHLFRETCDFDGNLPGNQTDPGTHKCVLCCSRLCSLPISCALPWLQFGYPCSSCEDLAWW